MIEGFEKYLSTTAFIQSKYVAYYLRWVSYCYEYLQQPFTCLLTSDQIQSYLNHISKTRQDWQVKQAEAALRLYGYYVSSGNSPGKVPAQTLMPSKASSHWPDLEKRPAMR